MKKIGIPFLLVSLTVFAACGLVGGEEHSNHPDIPGKIVFSAKNEAGTSQIYTMKANGSDVRQLTHFGPEGGAADPAWSPDGSRIAFANYIGATTLGPYLYVMDADGGHMRPLKRRPNSSIKALIGSAPAWSPDGTKIAFQVCTNCEAYGHNYEISYVDVAGPTYDHEQLHAVTDNPHSDMNPTWSPDGQRIAFVSDRDYVAADTLRFRKDLYVLSLTGANLKRLTNSGFIGSYTWLSSDHLAYVTYNANTNWKSLNNLDIKTKDNTLIKNNIEVNEFWILWDSINQQLFSIDKKFQRLPVAINIYDMKGNLSKQFKLKDSILKTALSFDLYIQNQ